MLAESFSAGPERFQGLEVTLAGHDSSKQAVIENAWLHDGRLVLKFAGVDSIDEAEKLRGLEVRVPSSQREPAAEGEVFLTDLVGCEMIDRRTGDTVGVVEGWMETGGPPLLQIRDPRGGEVLVPFVRSFLIQIDVEAKRILADLPEGLRELNPS